MVHAPQAVEFVTPYGRTDGGTWHPQIPLRQSPATLRKSSWSCENINLSRLQSLFRRMLRTGTLIWACHVPSVRTLDYWRCYSYWVTIKKNLKSKKKTKNKGYYLCFFHFSSENKGYYLCFFHFSVDMDRKIEVCQIVPFWFCESCGLARCALPHVQPLLYSLTLLSTLFGKNDWSRLLPRGADSSTYRH